MSNITENLVDSKKISAEIADNLYLQAPVSNATLLIFAVLLFFFLDRYFDSLAHIIWSLVMTIVALYRLFLYHQRKNKKKTHTATYWINHYIITSFIVGLIWGSLFLLPYNYQDSFLYGVHLALFLGVTVSTIPVLSISLTAFFCYTLPIIFCFVIAIYNLNTSTSLFIIIAASVYYIMLSLLARNYNRQTIHSINLQFQNETLIQQLRQEVAQRESLIEVRTRQLEHLAHHDELTKLPNRLLLSDRLNQMIKSAHRDHNRSAVLFIDLDNFKRINDSLGHSVGDMILKETAKRLQLCVRETDTVARLGGDEFTIIINDIIDNDIVTEIATKIIQELQKKFQVETHTLHITSSIGISIYPNDAISAEDLLRNADTAMYKAKDGGRNTYRFYTEDMTQKAFQHILMENNLRHALQQNELTVYYQPQVNGKNHNIVGMEALVRWQHPELGIIPTNQFIPLAEKSGLIVLLGEQVFDIATKQMACWMEDYNFNGRMAINLSVKQLHQKNIFQILSDILKANHCKPEWIELEITENYVMSDPQQAISTLQKFQDMGIRITLDDFGTGYSSLSYLKRLPINKLKIDQSFVQNMMADEDDRIIITSIISLANNMKLQVIAEGVETIEQKNFVLEQGCELIQGFYYSDPVTGQEMAELLDSADWKH